jgi:ketosteroid isomerase-like protein
MSQDNVAVIRRLYELFPDLAGPAPGEELLAEYFDPAIHIDMTRRVFNPATYHGYDGLLRSLGELREVWEQFVLRPERFFDAGDDVLVLETAHGRGRGGGVDVLNRSASRYSMHGGRIVHLVVYEDRSEALHALGLRE